MAGIKVGDRVRFLLSGLEAVILRIDEKDDSFQVVVRGVWYKFDLVELAEPVRTKLIPFQASQWTPEQKVVTRKELKQVRVLCVDADNYRHPVIGFIENRIQETWTINGGIDSDTNKHDNDLMVVVEIKTKTLYGYWNDTRKESRTYESEIQRNKEFDFYNDKNIRIKFQTEIEL